MNARQNPLATAGVAIVAGVALYGIFKMVTSGPPSVEHGRRKVQHEKGSGLYGSSKTDAPDADTAGCSVYRGLYPEIPGNYLLRGTRLTFCQQAGILFFIFRENNVRYPRYPGGMTGWFLVIFPPGIVVFPEAVTRAWGRKDRHIIKIPRSCQQIPLPGSL